MEAELQVDHSCGVVHEEVHEPEDEDHEVDHEQVHEEDHELVQVGLADVEVLVGRMQDSHEALDHPVVLEEVLVAVGRVLVAFLLALASFP